MFSYSERSGKAICVNNRFTVVGIWNTEFCHGLTFIPCALLKFRPRSVSAHKEGENSYLPVWFLPPSLTNIRLKLHQVPTCWVLGSMLHPGLSDWTAAWALPLWSLQFYWAKVHDDSEIITAFQILNNHKPVILFNSSINEGVRTGSKKSLLSEYLFFLVVKSFALL